MINRILLYLLVPGSFFLLAGSSCEPCPPNKEPIVYTNFFDQNHQPINPNFTRVYGSAGGEEGRAIGEPSDSTYELPLSLHEDETSFIFEDSSTTYSLSFTYERVVDYQDKECGYVMDFENLHFESDDFQRIRRRSNLFFEKYDPYIVILDIYL